MTIKVLSFTAVILAALTGPVWAGAPSYTMEDVTACSQDAMKLCKDKLPDLDAIEVCMKANYDSLHPACKARFDREK